MRNKRPKRALARKMMTHEEIKDNVNPFDCKDWEKKKDNNKRKTILKSKYADNSMAKQYE